LPLVNVATQIRSMKPIGRSVFAMTLSSLSEPSSLSRRTDVPGSLSSASRDFQSLPARSTRAFTMAFATERSTSDVRRGGLPDGTTSVKDAVPPSGSRGSAASTSGGTIASASRPPSRIRSRSACSCAGSRGNSSDRSMRETSGCAAPGGAAGSFSSFMRLPSNSTALTRSGASSSRA
jgi:hypothetical protein